MLIDTDVIIWYMRGNENAFQIIESQTQFHISVITFMEVVQGLRNKKELSNFRRALRDWNADVIYINEEISIKAMFYVERFFLSHSIQLADALIASTALSHGLTILTANIKHYQMIHGIQLKRFYP